MGYTNSPLVDYTKLSPNHSGQRTHSIDRITPHCVVGQCSVETLGDIFMPKSKDASCNYGIGSDGRVLLCVEEKNRSWCSSSESNDQRAVTIECASDSYDPYAFKDVVYKKLIDLCTDICKRNGKNKLIWFGDKNKTLNYSPQKGEMILTVHRWFANKSCPGNWMYSRMGDLATKVTNALAGIQPEPRDKDLYQGDLATPVLSRGDYGTEVGYLQDFLNWFGNYKLDVDKSFGPATETALKDFQKYSKIDVDGVYGPDSYAAADKAKKKVPDQTPAPTPQPTSETYPGPFPTMVLAYGSSGSQVGDLQKFLNWYGNYGLDVDWSYGPATQSAVKDFQSIEGLAVDGVFGPASNATAKKAHKKSTDVKKYAGTIAKPVLSYGDNNAQVGYLQKFLNWYGKYGLNIDGIFGSATEKALKDFQKKEKIEVDGIYGKGSQGAANKYK